jgi:L-alanine-DL-glutamate epimerase-like enolase superfamily enzyme
LALARNVLSVDVVGETPQHTLGTYKLVTLILLIIEEKTSCYFNESIDQAYLAFPSNPAGTIAAIDIALHDLFGKSLNMSVLDFYGTENKSSTHICNLLALRRQKKC